MKIYKRAVLLLVTSLISISSIAQTKKVDVKPEDYKKWSTLSEEQISPDGSFICYKVNYDSKMDTVFVQNSKTGKTRNFQHVNEFSFSDNSKYFTLISKDNTLTFYDLRSGALTLFDNVQSFKETSIGGFFILALQSKGNETLLVLNKELHPIKTIENVKNFAIAEDGKMVVHLPFGVAVINPNKNFENNVILIDSVGKFNNFIWSKSNNTVAFLRETSITSNDHNHNLYHYDYGLHVLKILNNSNPKLNDLYISSHMQTPILFSNDGKQVFFYTIDPRHQIESDSIVEVWNSSDKLVYPEKKLYGNPFTIPKIAVWFTQNGFVNRLATEELPLSLLTTDRQFVLTYSHLTNQPQYTMVSDVDFYLTNVKTQEKNLFLQKQTTTPYSIGCSPLGKYIYYYKEENWWIYNTSTATHTNMTINLPVSFANADYDEPSTVEGYSSPGFTSKDEFLIIYDEYDVWLISPDGNIKKRITRGRESKISFRICDRLYMMSDTQGSADFVRFNIVLKNGLILSALGDDKQTGYYKWNIKNKLEKLVYENRKLSEIKKAKNSETYIYIDEDFETPPSISFMSNRPNNGKKVFQSNKHYNDFNWGKSDILSYNNSVGKNLQAAIFYPSNYIVGKKYPMIVYIYSRVAKYVHDYINPGGSQLIGFANVNYTNDGYIVLMPDIRYEVGNPGKSMVDCVESAVNFVVSKGIVEENKIGLIGHSYGGYETNHIITQSTIFAAAVAGSSVTNLINSYLSINEFTGTKMDWRYESQQYRIGKSLFENMEIYMQDSPVLNVKNIDTPLLSWAGKNDMEVDYKQAVQLHLALRRLSKRNVLLLYPSDGHIITGEKAQFDLIDRTKNWFDHFLKGQELISDAK